MKDESGSVSYAHSIPGGPPEKWQPLTDHLRNVAESAGHFASSFQSAEWARNAAWLHDLGKADSAFQGYLKRQNGLDDAEYDSGRVNHSSAGAAFAEEILGQCAGRILAYLVAGHHAGLPDWYSAETGNAALSVRMEEGRENLKRIREYAEQIKSSLAEIRPPEFARKAERVHLWMRMLFSCLVDADFLDTESFMNPEQASRRQTGFSTVPELKTKFDVHLSGFQKNAAKTPVNGIRNEILAACRTAAESASGLFSLTVPTGGGKTLSSMAFALDHATRREKNRIIYVIPYTSIIEQTAMVFSSIFGEENVIEHHCNLDPEKDTQRVRLACENWDAPIVVTTNVQFFESLCAARPSRCRKLHRLVNSVIILDEAQLIPPALLSPCVDAINQLVENYGSTVVLSTATQPALPGLLKSREIIPDPAGLYTRLKRTSINIGPVGPVNPVSWSDLSEKLRSYEQVLCIVNTRRDCHDLFKLMPENTIHLSALMCGEHRSKVIAGIKAKLAAGDPCRVISTQLVEAGVDIDFPVVYRALAGLDSIAQAAGRCNREGKLNDSGELGQVYVFVPPKSAPPGILRKGENVSKALFSLPDFSPDSPAEYTRYFNDFYSSLNDTGKQRFHEYLVKDVQGHNPQDCFKIAFRTAATHFKLIDDRARRSVIVRYGESNKWINQLRAIGPTRETMRKLQRYAVNLHVHVAEKMKTDGLLEDVHDGILVQTMPNLYDEIIGLDIFRDSLPIEDITGV
jgi:CRISPR-associated endonuclease/helicase Cas3